MLDISHKSIHVLQRSLMVNAYYRNKGDITNCTLTWWIFGIRRLHNIYRYHPIALCVILCLFIWGGGVLCVIVGWSGLVYVSVLAFWQTSCIPTFIFEFHIQTTSISTPISRGGVYSSLTQTLSCLIKVEEAQYIL